MSIYKQSHVRKFIQKHVIGAQAEFNVLPEVGLHEDVFTQAAHQRGLEVVKFGSNQYFYAGDKVVGGLHSMVSSLVSLLAIRTCQSKSQTSSLFSRGGLPIPGEQVFGVSDFDAAREYFAGVAAPLVVKPDSGAAGNGVTTGVRTGEQFDSAWDRAVEVAGSRGAVVVQDHVSGVDIRAFVVGDRVVGAVSRLPAFVTGDGQQTVQELVDAKEQLRGRNAYLQRMPIVVDDGWLQNSGYSSDSVPSMDEVVFVNGTVNLHQGGEHVDITDVMNLELKQLAVDACRVIPGLGVAGIDLLTPSVDSAAGAVVLEANTWANVLVHHVPAYGRSRDVAGPVVDAMIAQSGRGVSAKTSLGKRVRRIGRRVLGERATQAYWRLRSNR